MAFRIATVITDGLNLRKGPGTNFDVVAVVLNGQKVQVTGVNGVWRRITCDLGTGFVHGDFISVDGSTPLSKETNPPEPRVEALDDQPAEPGPGTAAVYVIKPGDTLAAIGSALGVDWRQLAALNGIPDPFIIRVNQVLRIPGATVHDGHAEVHDETPATAATYVVQSGDTLGAIGTKLGVPWQRIAEANGIRDPFPISPGQVLTIPGGGSVSPRPDTSSSQQSGGTAPAGTLRVRNPFRLNGITTTVSSSSLQADDPHHTPFGGTHSCDLHPSSGDARGVPVFFDVDAPAGVEIRGVVSAIGPACASGILSDGGNKVQLSLQKRSAGGAWQDCNSWLLYAHLDPVDVSINAVVSPGTQLGRLGPQPPAFYNSRCAQGSHTHIEARPCSDVVLETRGGTSLSGHVITISI